MYSFDNNNNNNNNNTKDTLVTEFDWRRTILSADYKSN